MRRPNYLDTLVLVVSKYDSLSSIAEMQTSAKKEQTFFYLLSGDMYHSSVALESKHDFTYGAPLTPIFP